MTVISKAAAIKVAATRAAVIALGAARQSNMRRQARKVIRTTTIAAVNRVVTAPAAVAQSSMLRQARKAIKTTTSVDHNIAVSSL